VSTRFGVIIRLTAEPIVWKDDEVNPWVGVPARAEARPLAELDILKGLKPLQADNFLHWLAIEGLMKPSVLGHVEDALRNALGVALGEVPAE
jgi:hypothetical protein